MYKPVPRGEQLIRTPFLHILHTPPKKYGSSPWKWVPVHPDTFVLLVRQMGLVMRKRVGGKIVRLFNDPRLEMGD